ncbi:aldehyde dehydrogenase domain-containing protein [Kockovaella imperatae]|uniref:Aldehyde dehydrogenase domain-containing protein n=1 Tax=Kockovaella imperatae TaxID=4999 RepID=A0A1Y1UC32_9TREE|nr:aldehyde dehydrogenase domain-containing protein [Kockovaella imperatae]ORX35562.1 aldehyde dehydrogenase domain-containing protein [Kockovaella imperatae]
MSHYASVSTPKAGSLKVPTGIFINNEWSPSSSGETFSTVNPATNKPLLDISHATKDDVDRAVKAARKAFETTWANNVTAAERGRLLFKLADLMERDTDKLAAVESLNTGKGVRMARTVDLADSIACLRYYAGLADKLHGTTIDNYAKEKFIYTIQQPIGYLSPLRADGSIPWNYPIQMWAWKIAPALAAGCCVVMKPSELTPLTALMLSDLVAEAGFPPGVFNTVPGLGATTGDAIARHDDIDKVAFTGSVLTGRKISIAAAESNLKKVTLELGGKSPIVIFDSADVEEAADWAACAIWFNSGQDCCAGSRVYVQQGAYEGFVKALKARAEATAIGQPEDEKTSFGPLISQLQRDKVLRYIDSGKAEGATVVTGGRKWAPGGEGFWIEPTILTDIKQDMTVIREEIFGPVVCVSTFDDETEGVAMANNTTYGLAAAVFTNDTRQATRVSRALNAGTVWINEYMLVDNGAPFGGFKQSGIGRELGVNGMETYMQVKAVHQNLTQTSPWPL